MSTASCHTDNARSFVERKNVADDIMARWNNYCFRPYAALTKYAVYRRLRKKFKSGVSQIDFSFTTPSFGVD